MVRRWLLATVHLFALPLGLGAIRFRRRPQATAYAHPLDRIILIELSPFLLAAALLPWGLQAQAKSERRPAFALHLGVGGHQGWIGGAGELFVVPGRLSAWAGAGVLPVFGLTTAAAAALRWYPPPMEKHRVFVDASWTLVEVGQSVDGPRTYRTYRRYAAGVMLGYSYLARSGLSLAAGGGLAGLTSDGGIVPLVHLAVGWNWRR